MFTGAGAHLSPTLYKNGPNTPQTHEWLRRLNEAGRVPYMIYPNHCGRCGELWPNMFMVPDEEWKKYIPIRHRDEMICQACYDEIKALIDGATEAK